MTITGSLANTTVVVEKTVIIDMAGGETLMKATHTCMKTDFMRNRTRELVTVTIPSLYAKNIHQDILSGKASNWAGIHKILDADLDIAGVYLLDADKQQQLRNQSHTSQSRPSFRFVT